MYRVGPRDPSSWGLGPGLVPIRSTRCNDQLASGRRTAADPSIRSSGLHGRPAGTHDAARDRSSMADLAAAALAATCSIPPAASSFVSRPAGAGWDTYEALTTYVRTYHASGFVGASYMCDDEVDVRTTVRVRRPNVRTRTTGHQTRTNTFCIYMHAWRAGRGTSDRLPDRRSSESSSSVGCKYYYFSLRSGT